jgi:hypothetical protein
MKQVLNSVVSAVAFLLFTTPTMGIASDQVYLAAQDTDKVVLNPKSLRYHIPTCKAALKCTHCIETTRKDAKAKGGVPCKLCGAGEI